MEEYVRGISGRLNKELNSIQSNNVIVDAVLNTKYEEISQKNITFILKINDLSTLHIRDEDIVIILSNLLNNAIEACEKCIGKKIIKLKFVAEDENVIISVKNTYEDSIVWKGDRIQTTKVCESDEHGIGVTNIIDTIKKYEGSYVIQNVNAK